MHTTQRLVTAALSQTGLSRVELAALLDTSDACVGHWTTGVRTPSALARLVLEALVREPGTVFALLQRTHDAR